jgi:hypothetical protein
MAVVREKGIKSKTTDFKKLVRKKNLVLNYRFDIVWFIFLLKTLLIINMIILNTR